MNYGKKYGTGNLLNEWGYGLLAKVFDLFTLRSLVPRRWPVCGSYLANPVFLV